MRRSLLSSSVPLLSLAALAQASPVELLGRDNGGVDYKSKCEGFRISGIENVVQVEESYYYPKGKSLNFTSLQSALVADDIPSFCRVQILVYTDPSVGQFANSEVWLPDNWNGRFAGIGNGGLSGGVGYQAMGWSGVYEGFATMGSNGGHNSSSPGGEWALNNPAAITDFGALRAFVESTGAAKAIIEQYYGKSAKKNYFFGCSTGGRQGLQLAQRFGDLYDGILAGAPAADWINLMAFEGHVRNLVEPVNGSTWIPGATWDVIHKEILKQCDEVIDGVADQVLENPNLCRFRPEVLSCGPKNENSEACLSEDQLAVVKKIYSDYYETNQTLIFPQYDFGAELVYTGLFGPQPFGIPTSYFRYFVRNDTTFQLSDLNYDLVLEAKQRNVGQLVSVDPDITAFTKRGGKLLQYHGLADQLIPSGSSARYYNSVDAFTRMNGKGKTDDFYRYFPVPGMLHCSGGPGVNSIGTSQQSRGAGYTAKTDFRKALMEWVENGKAPDVIIGTHYEAPTTGTKAVATFKRPLCKYPSQSKYKGSGDWKDPSSWYCQAPYPNF